MGELTTLAQTP